MMKIKALLLSLALGAGLMGATTIASHAQTEPAARETAQAQPPVEILLAKINRARQADGSPNAFVVTGPAGLALKKVVVTTEKDNLFNADLTVDDFKEELGDSLVVRVGDKVLVPYSYGGDKDRYWSPELRDLNKESAEILNGGPLAGAPKESFEIEYSPYQGTYAVNKAVEVQLGVHNVGAVPLTIYWGTNGGGNYPCRDTSLAFTATLDGKPMPANPKPLPPGFISSPFVSKPDNTLKRGVDLSEWLQFSQPGEYLVDATYTLEINNPEKDASPASWKVDYHNQFSVRVANEAAPLNKIAAPPRISAPAKSQN